MFTARYGLIPSIKQIRFRLLKVKHLLINYAVSIFIVMHSALKYRERRKNYGTVETKSLQLTYMNILNVLTQKKI